MVVETQNFVTTFLQPSTHCKLHFPLVPSVDLMLLQTKSFHAKRIGITDNRVIDHQGGVALKVMFLLMLMKICHLFSVISVFVIGSEKV